MHPPETSTCRPTLHFICFVSTHCRTTEEAYSCQILPSDYQTDAVPRLAACWKSHYMCIHSVPPCMWNVSYSTVRSIRRSFAPKLRAYWNELRWRQRESSSNAPCSQDMLQREGYVGCLKVTRLTYMVFAKTLQSDRNTGTFVHALTRAKSGIRRRPGDFTSLTSTPE